MNNHPSKCVACRMLYDDEMFSIEDSSLCVFCSGEEDETSEEVIDEPVEASVEDYNSEINITNEFSPQIGE